MSTEAELQALLERVKAATGPNYALEVDIHAMCAGAVDTPDRRAPAYTASLDAITALIERELPGWDFTICSHRFDGSEHGKPYADLASQRFIDGDADEEEWAEAMAASMPLALTAAFLSAMIAKMEDGHA